MIDEAEIEARLREEATACHRWSDAPRARYGIHHHPYRKILYVAAGSITFIPASSPPVRLKAGDRIDLAAGLDHGAEVGEEGVVCWEGQARP
jgi:quercetin dioxygenase-like cupin family protein